MPNKKLSEYQIKMLFYNFIGKKEDFIFTKNKNVNIQNKIVAKVDDGSKRRFKRGLVKINPSPLELNNFIKNNHTKNIFIEPLVDIKKEYYLMIRNEEENNTIYLNNMGGINQMNPLENCIKYEVNITENFNFDFINKKINNIELSKFIEKIYIFFKKYHFTFLEINPLALTSDNNYHAIDFAGFIDSCAIYLFDNKDKEIINMNYLQQNNYPIEDEINYLDSITGSSLKFKMINEKGSIWTLVAGGGASVVYTDAIVNLGYVNQLANYGEYSGNPPKELVKKYVTLIFDEMRKVNEKKILFIGGGIANFTDVYKTFEGIFQGIISHMDKYKDEHIFNSTEIYVRRGGPNYQKALDQFNKIAKDYNLNIKIYGPETDITKIVSLALRKKEFIKKDFNNIKFNNDLSNKFIKSSLNIDKKDSILIYSYNPSAIQRILDFDFMCGRKPSIIGIIDPRRTKDSNEQFYFGGEIILISLIKDFKIGMNKFKSAKHIVSFASFRSAFETSMKILDYDFFNSLTIIAEGIPEEQERLLQIKSKEKHKVLIGPATVGLIAPGRLRIGNTGGSNENIISSKLYRPGSVGFVTRSGGLLNELCNILSQKTDGVHMGISIGGDRYPGSDFINFLLKYQDNPEIKMMVFIGEVGGIQELIISQAVHNGLITKPIIGYCIGTSGDYFENEIQFGHAGATANSDFESAEFKNNYMKSNGIIVPENFECLSEIIEKEFNKLNIEKEIDITPNLIPKEKEQIDFFSSISNELKDELEYNNIKISDIVNKGLGYTIGNLWLKKELPEWASEYLELILKITADHGSMVSGACNTIIASRASKDLVSSLCSGLLTIGDSFGGAINEAGNIFYSSIKNNISPQDLIHNMKKENKYISGIGHRIKSKDNPDKRVEILKNFINKHFPTTTHVKYALNVEKITLEKRNNLILNVDGLIAASLLDLFENINMNNEEIELIVNEGLLNGFFVLGRTIGFIGHWFDQRRLKQKLYRKNKNQIKYI